MPVGSFAINLELVILTQAYLKLTTVYSDFTCSGVISDAGISPWGMNLVDVGVDVDVGVGFGAEVLRLIDFPDVSVGLGGVIDLLCVSDGVG